MERTSGESKRKGVKKKSESQDEGNEPEGKREMMESLCVETATGGSEGGRRRRGEEGGGGGDKQQMKGMTTEQQL